jgi:hypothetical protein
MKRNRFPSGWNEARVLRVLEHYERQTEDEALAEDEACFRSRGQTVMVVPKRLVPAITGLIEREGLRKRTPSRRPNEASRRAAPKTRRR